MAGNVDAMHWVFFIHCKWFDSKHFCSQAGSKSNCVTVLCLLDYEIAAIKVCSFFASFYLQSYDNKRFILYVCRSHTTSMYSWNLCGNYREKYTFLSLISDKVVWYCHTNSLGGTICWDERATRKSVLCFTLSRKSWMFSTFFLYLSFCFFLFLYFVVECFRIFHLAPDAQDIIPHHHRNIVPKYEIGWKIWPTIQQEAIFICTISSFIQSNNDI